ncbi:MAG: phage baseplate protein [Chloroflexi bacterium]|nr:phage baseplate protein [Chloroflexota bacterium]
MRALSATQMLRMWELGYARSPNWRALVILATAFPEVGFDALAGLSIGQRDAHLLALRNMTFGQRIDCMGTCPACAEAIEMAFETTDIWVHPEHGPPDEPLAVSYEGYEVVFHLPTSRDLLALTGAEGAQALMARCIVAVTYDDQDVAVAELPEEVIVIIGENMQAADPQASIWLQLTCPACGHDWSAPFDIVTFFWHEIETQARRLLRQVHLLASAYGWSEAGILRLSPLRRQLYLDMIGS